MPEIEQNAPQLRRLIVRATREIAGAVENVKKHLRPADCGS
jgi:hypothetical protein